MSPSVLGLHSLHGLSCTLINGEADTIAVHRTQVWMLGAGQTSAGANKVTAGLGDAIGRPAAATISFAEFVSCYKWCVTHPSNLLERTALACVVYGNRLHQRLSLTGCA